MHLNVRILWEKQILYIVYYFMYVGHNKNKNNIKSSFGLHTQSSFFSLLVDIVRECVHNTKE